MDHHVTLRVRFVVLFFLLTCLMQLSSMLFGHGQIYDPIKASVFEKKH
jgi:hypothetical protein